MRSPLAAHRHPLRDARRSLPLASGLVALALLGACSDDDKQDADAAETGEPGNYGPVRGDLEITSIEISQSLVQPIYADGEVLNPATYGVPLVPGRHMWVRALWDPPFEWTPRPLTARLHLEFPDGTETVIDDRETEKGAPPMVQGKSKATDLLTGFYWRVDAKDVVPGLRYSITVIEPEPAPDIPESTGQTQWPRDSNTSMAIRDAPAELDLKLVGIRYDAGGCVSDTSTLTDTDIEAVRAAFEAWNGIGSDAVNVDTSINIDVDTPLDVVGLLGLGGQVRAEYGDDPDAFFYFLFDDCTPAPSGILGIAPVNMDPPSPGDAATRYGVGLWHANDVQESVNTAVHEIGHSQGAPHAPCGGASGTDPNYPHDNASIGIWGLDLLTAVYYDPASYTDYMSYCRPFWVSDYRFTKTYEVQSTLTAWGQGDGTGPVLAPPSAPGTTGVVLTGVVQLDGQTRWWINDNPQPPAGRLDGELVIELRTAAGPRTLATDVLDLPDIPGGARLVRVALVDGIGREDIESIAVHGALELELAAPTIDDARALAARRFSR